MCSSVWEDGLSGFSAPATDLLYTSGCVFIILKQMLAVTIVLTLTACISYLILLYAVLRGETETRLKLLFSGYLFGILVMQVGLFLTTVTSNPELTEIYYSLTAAGFTIFLGVFFPLICRFSGHNSCRLPSLLSAVSLAGALAVLLSGSIFSGVYMGGAGFYVPEINYTTVFFFIPLFSFWAWGLVMLLRKYVRSSSLYQRNRLKYPLIGSIIFVAGGLINLTPLKEYPVDVICYLLNAVFFGYAVIKKRLPDVKIAFKRGTLTVLAFSVLLAIFYLITWSASWILPDSFSAPVSGLIALLVVLLLIVLILGKKISFVVSGILFGEADIHQTLLNSYSKTMLTAVHPQAIYEELDRTLATMFAIDHISIYRKNENKHIFTLEYRNKAAEGEEPAELIDGKCKIALLLAEEHMPLIREELKTQLNQAEMRDVCSVFTSAHPPDVIVPLFEGMLLTGMVYFREKDRNKIYVQNDVVFFTILANLTSAALMQAKMFEDLEKNIKEKELLLKEVHHRVKNNLQLISSLLELQKSEIHNEEFERLFSVSQNRINSIAHVHESIYISKSLSTINSRIYIESLTADIQGQYLGLRNVSVEFQLQEIELSIQQAIPLGLIFNELITNAFQHAFVGEGGWELAFRSLKLGDKVEFQIEDNGAGFTKDKASGSLGLTIVESLAEGQLRGKWQVHSGAGTRHSITFPL